MRNFQIYNSKDQNLLKVCSQFLLQIWKSLPGHIVKIGNHIWYMNSSFWEFTFAGFSAKLMKTSATNSTTRLKEVLHSHYSSNHLWGAFKHAIGVHIRNLRPKDAGAKKLHQELNPFLGLV